MYKLHFDNFLINEHDDDDDGNAVPTGYSHILICTFL